MGYTFTKKPFLIRKNAASVAALRKLRRFLDANEPELVYFLQHTWNFQGKAITYKELREAILAGALTEEQLAEWYQEYTMFVHLYLRPAWINAMETASEQIHEKYPEFYFNPYADGVKMWVEERAATFVTEVTTTQIEGLQAVIQRAAVLQDISVDQLARVIRPMVGLNRPQAIANMKYFEKLLEGGTKQKKAIDLATRYAARQQRYRAYMIARTELAFSYNQGSYEGTKQAQDKGYIGDCVKIWCTADDERVCPVCGGLEGKQVAMDEEFDFKTNLSTVANPTIKQTPPAHPNCRCTVLYKEIAPPIPKFNPGVTITATRQE